MTVKTIILAATVALTSSIAFAQPAPIGSSATSGNGAVINRGPVTTVGEDLDFRRHRAYGPYAYAPRRIMRHRRHYYSEYGRY